jgi:hypothetical protein
MRELWSKKSLLAGPNVYLKITTSTLFRLNAPKTRYFCPPKTTCGNRCLAQTQAPSDRHKKTFHHTLNYFEHSCFT